MRSRFSNTHTIATRERKIHKRCKSFNVWSELNFNALYFWHSLKNSTHFSCEKSAAGKSFFLFHPKIILSLEILCLMCKTLINLLRAHEFAGKKENLLFVMPSTKSNHFFFISSNHSCWECVNNDFVHPHDMTLLLHFLFFRTQTLNLSDTFNQIIFAN